MTIEKIIYSFAKENKYSKIKLEAFVKDILATIPRMPQGKPVSDVSIHIRDLLRSKKGQKFTSKQIANKLNVSPVIINNNLRYLQQREKIASVVGKERTSPRGKMSLVWQIAA